MKELDKIFNQFSDLKVGVIGDLMLDTYLMGRVDRISPEAPVPVITLQHKEERIGGAGNVALNGKALGAQVFSIGITGNDGEGKVLQELLSRQGIVTDYLLETADRPTTTKTRILSRNQQMLRVDKETSTDISKKDEAALLLKLRQFVEQEDPDILIFEDYNKGVLTEQLIRSAIDLCKASGVLTAVDPKRKNFFSYRGVDIFKPNLKEVKEALNLVDVAISLDSLKDVHRLLTDQLQHRISFITLSEKGVFYQHQKEAARLPSHIRNIADVSGAGDTVIAVASLVYAATKNPYLMAEVANIAGGMVCEEVGTVAVNREHLLHECELLLS